MYDSPTPKSRADARIEALLRETEARLRRQNQVLVDLARRPSIHAGNLAEALREITEAAATTLEVERVSVWFFTDDRASLRCSDIFDRGSGRHVPNVEALHSAKHPIYFRALETERTITASDAQRDPRTSGFNDYHHAIGITSVIDAPIRRLGQISGVVCHEHVGPIRYWTVEEENFASSIADLVVIAMDAAERRLNHETLRRRVEFEQLISRISTHFINVAESELDDAVVDALASIAKFAGADRAHVVLLDDDRTTGSMTHEWCAEGMPARHAMLANVPIASFRWTTEMLMRGENVRLNSMDDLPAEAEAERRLHEMTGNKSVIAVPMVVNKTLSGFVGLNAVRREIAWTDDDVALLRIAGEIFVSAIERTRAMRALQSSEERHRMLFQRNLAGVYRNTLDGRIIECNDALAHILGFESREELMEQYAPALYYDPREREHVIAAIEQQGSLTSAEICLRRKDGSPVWLLESVHLAGSGDSRILEGTIIDITDRKHAENALRESELRYRTLIERMREGVSQIDNDGRMQFVNDRLCEMVGYSRQEMIGARKDELLSATPEDVAVVQSKLALRQRGISDRYEMRFRRKDGEVIWVEIGGAPVFDALGNVVGSIGVHNDITERRRAEGAVRESEARYRLMADNSTDLIARTTKKGVILYASPAVQSLLGYDPAEVVGRSVAHFIDQADNDVVELAIDSLSASSPMTFSYRAVRKDGMRVWFETTSRAVVDPDTNEVVEIVSVSRDISERKRAEEQIEYQAYHDALTGLPNRRLFRDRLTVALAHARRTRRPVAVMFLDLDSFKFVNDTLGHSLGDELLKVIAGRLSAVLREEDTIARMGGDEFTVLIANIQTLADVPVIAQKLLDAVAQPMRVEGHDLFITTSIGIAMYPDDGDTAEALLKNADNAMYRAKEVGRSSFQLCAASTSQRSVDRLSVENALRRAIDRGEFVLHYQPQIRIDTMEVVGMEALLRWNRPEFGIVMPETFIPIAEETRLIVPIGEWVLREACRQAKGWDRNLRLAVNLSPRQFQQSDLRMMIHAALTEAGLDPERLEVEITESTAMHNTERTVATMRSLREMGVRIALDDFGTGHSALNYLRSFPIDSVKIDQAFVHEIEGSASDRAIVSAVISMAHGMNLRVTAEGVETEAQLQFLRERGCEEVQGYLFGRPAAAL